MSVPVEELTKNDYKVLEYINRFTSVHKNDIEKHFNNRIVSLDYILSKLSKVDYKLNGDVPFPIANSNYIEEEFDRPTDDYETPRKSLNMFHITDIGRDVLQNYHIKQRVAKKDLWLKNALIPVIVSFVTTNITMYLIPKLPLILKWLCDILSKFFSS